MKSRLALAIILAVVTGLSIACNDSDESQFIKSSTIICDDLYKISFYESCPKGSSIVFELKVGTGNGGYEIVRAVPPYYPAEPGDCYPFKETKKICNPSYRQLYISEIR